MIRISISRRFTTAAATLALCSVFVPREHAHAQEFPFKVNFSADLFVNGETTSKLYVGNRKVRREVFRNAVLTGVQITDYGNKTMWTLMPQQKIAMDQSYLFRSISKDLTAGYPDPDHPCASMPDYTCRKLGAETVNGRPTQKWEMKGQDGKSFYSWIDPKLYLAVKGQDVSGFKEFRNIKEGPQPDNLFQVPPDYQKISGGPGGPPPQ